MHDATTESRLALPVSEKRDHIRGGTAATVTLVEYGDYECPHCGKAHAILAGVQEHFDDGLRFVFRHFPLTQIHPHAQGAAEAAEAAAAQARFWEMHDTLFENQSALDPESLAALASELGLNIPHFVRDAFSGATTVRVREDFLSGVRSGVNGTPTFFINGQRHDGPWDYESLVASISGAQALVARRGQIADQEQRDTAAPGGSKRFEAGGPAGSSRARKSK